MSDFMSVYKLKNTNLTFKISKVLISFILSPTDFVGQKELLYFFFSETSLCILSFPCQMEDIFNFFPTFSLPHSTD